MRRTDDEQLDWSRRPWMLADWPTSSLLRLCHWRLLAPSLAKLLIAPVCSIAPSGYSLPSIRLGLGLPFALWPLALGLLPLAW